MTKKSYFVFADAKTLASKAAHIISNKIVDKPNLVLGLATGSTMLGLYRALIKIYQQDKINFSDIKTFNLDEYLGIQASHNQSYCKFMHDNLFSKLNINPTNINLLNGTAPDAVIECKNYENKIVEAGGIDLQLLGIGRNGHIAFNEPGSPRDSRTRVTNLSDDTIVANSDGRFFSNPDDVPKQALSMGIATILEAKEILLLASGAGKAAAVKNALVGEPSTNVPASFVPIHPNYTFLLDKEAASLIKR